jgi:hypothetical protein
VDQALQVPLLQQDDDATFGNFVGGETQILTFGELDQNDDVILGNNVSDKTNLVLWGTFLQLQSTFFTHFDITLFKKLEHPDYNQHQISCLSVTLCFQIGYSIFKSYCQVACSS